MMFSVVLFGSCLVCCLAESYNFASAPYSSTATGVASTYAGNEWPPYSSSSSNGFKMPMSLQTGAGMPKGKQFSFQPSTFYSQLNYQPSSETVPSYRALSGYSKSAPAYSFGGYSGHHGNVAQVAQPAFTQSQWNQQSLQSAYPMTSVFASGKAAYSSGVLPVPYSGQSSIAQVAQPAFASVPSAKMFSGQDASLQAGYPTVTADGYLKDTPEVLEAKKAHFAEKMRIAKYMGSDDSQYSYTSSAPQYSSYPQSTSAAGNSFASSYYTPTAEGMPTTSTETFQSNPVDYSHTVGRQKRAISDCLLPSYGPTFHALPAHPAVLPPPPAFLPHPATMTLAHSFPTFHHSAELDHSFAESIGL